MDDFDDLRPRMSAPAQPDRDREKPGAERPSAPGSTPDVYEAVQAARRTTGGKGARGSRRPPRTKPRNTAAEAPARTKLGGKDLDVPATVSAIAIGALIGFLVGFFAGREGK